MDPDLVIVSWWACDKERTITINIADGIADWHQHTHTHTHTHTVTTIIISIYHHHHLQNDNSIHFIQLYDTNRCSVGSWRPLVTIKVRYRSLVTSLWHYYGHWHVKTYNLQQLAWKCQLILCQKISYVFNKNNINSFIITHPVTVYFAITRSITLMKLAFLSSHWKKCVWYMI